MVAARVVLPLPKDVHDVLEKALGGLHAGRPVPRALINLPLADLGNQPDAMIDAVRRKLGEVSTGPFWIKLEGLGTLGGNAPHTLYAEADLSRGLKDLHTLVGRAVREAGVPLEYQRWTPHVPIARFEALGQHDLKQIMSFLSRRAALTAGPFPVTDFQLIALRPDTPEPEVLETYPLNGR